MLSAFAVFRLRTNVNFSGCSTGSRTRADIHDAPEHNELQLKVPDTLMQDRIRQIEEPSCDARVSLYADCGQRPHVF